jgi:hypothetical protein
MSNVFAGSLIAMLCAGLFALALGAIGVILIIQYARNKQKAQASNSWPSAPGKITGHEIRVDEGDDDSNQVRYIPEVHFEYQIDGNPYQGKRISFGSEPDFHPVKRLKHSWKPTQLRAQQLLISTPRIHRKPYLRKACAR